MQEESRRRREQRDKRDDHQGQVNAESELPDMRYQDGEIHKMSDGEWIKAKNIIVQLNEMIVLDEVGRKKITTLGEGKAWVFRDGETIEAKWKKDEINQITKYYDNNGNEIEFNGGATWIEVIPDEDYLRY